MLRWAVPKDACQMAHIYLEALHDTYCQILPEEYFKAQTFLKAEKLWMDFLTKPENRCLIWEQDGQTAAFAGLRRKGEKAADLSALYVDRRWRGHGIGKKLIGTVLEQAQEHGFESVSISVVLKNTRAKTLYERLGAEFQNEFTYYFDDYPVQCGEYLWTLPCPEQKKSAAGAQTEGA